MLLNLHDIASQQLNNGNLADLYNNISEDNPIFHDILMQECNEGQGHSYSEVTGLPTIYYRLIGDGFPESKSTKRKVRNTVAIVGGRFEVDKKEASMSGNEARFMADEEMMFIHGVFEKLSGLIFYGNSNTDLDAFMGIHIRLSVPSADRTDSGYNLINGAGTDSVNTSVIGVVHHPKGFHGIYPKGAMAGHSVSRKNDEHIDGVTANTKLVGHERIIEQEFGIAVPNWKAIARICNIDVTDLTWNAATGANLRNLLSRLAMRLKKFKAGGKPVIYCNDTIYSFLDQQTQAAGSTALGYREIDGKEVLAWRGIPIKVCDAILNTEATVTGTFSTV